MIEVFLRDWTINREFRGGPGRTWRGGFFLALLLGERTDLRRWENGLEFKCDKKVGGQGIVWEEAPSNNPSAMEFLA